jgi:general secretion pathway protein G
MAAHDAPSSAPAHRSESRGGFTLLEILIVVVVLAILATLIAPHTTSATAESRREATRAQVDMLRRQIELYRLEHGGQLPDLSGGWNSLTAASTFKGQTFGPYLAATPKNPLNGRANVTDSPGLTAAGAECGFLYDYGGGNGSGVIRPTGPDAKSAYQP